MCICIYIYIYCINIYILVYTLYLSLGLQDGLQGIRSKICHDSNLDHLSSFAR